MNVEINLYQTKKFGNEILENAKELKQNINALYNILDKMPECWEGADATLFLNAMREVNMVELDEIQELIQTYGEYLQNIPDVYAILDEVYTSEAIG